MQQELLWHPDARISSKPHDFVVVYTIANCANVDKIVPAELDSVHDSYQSYVLKSIYAYQLV